jgi:Ca2+-binding RTX toxin-like protein
LANSYTFQITGRTDLISAAAAQSIAQCAQYVIGLVSRYIDWQGTIDFVVEIRPAADLTWSDADGLLPSVAQIGWNGSAWINQTLVECLTGVDSDLGRPDAGCTIYLAADGTIKNYGYPVWFDPAPAFDRRAAVPAGMHDFVGIYTHEVFHAFGFYAATKQWQDLMSGGGSVSYFTGAAARALYGAPLPFMTGSDHYGYTADPAVPINSGLMFQWGNYEHNRLDIGRIDLAILADLGHTIKTYEGLALFEMRDGAANLAGSGLADTLYGDYNPNQLVGGGGGDVLYGAAGDDLLWGDSGNDLLDGGPGNDLMRGGTGDDIYVVAEPGDVVVELAGEGVDEVRTALGSRSDPAQMYVLGANIENFTGTSAGAQGVYGNGLNNIIRMGAGNDLVVLDGGGIDDVDGGAGNDFIYFGAAFTSGDSVKGGSGTDTVGLLGTYMLTLEADDFTGVEKLALYSSGNAATPNGYSIVSHDGNVAAGATLQVVAQSLLAGETLVFNGAAETDGRFNVRGGRGSDTITGGAGADTIWGNLGADTLKGGAGADVFEYRAAAESTAASRDTILDFAKGDKINLIGIDADGDAANGNSKFAFIGGAAFSGTAGELRVSQDPNLAHAWLVEGDTDGDRVADFSLIVVAPNAYPLGKEDFWL